MRLYQESPNDSPGDGTLHPMAIEQLMPYVRAAGSWPVQHVMRDGRECHACGLCDQNLWFTSDKGGNQFLYTAEQITDVKVAHIRQAHSEVVNGNVTQAG